ncbi:MAG: PulJ/GspJ family protein [Oligoflexus sp.]
MPLKQNRPLKLSGFSLIELLMVVAILAIVSTLAFNTISQTNRDRAYNRALLDATQLTDRLTNIIKRDFTYRNGSVTIDISSDNLSLTLTRSGLAAGTTVSSDYQVTFKTLCRAASELTKGYGDLNTAYASTELAPISGCLRNINCPQNQVPYVAITTSPASGAHIPSYGMQQVPLISNNEVPFAMGVASCFYMSGNQLKIITEGVYPKDQSRIGVKGREIALGIENKQYKILP